MFSAVQSGHARFNEKMTNLCMERLDGMEVWTSHCPHCANCRDTRGLGGAAEKQVKKLGACSRPEYLAATRNYKHSNCYAAQEDTELKTWLITSLDLKYLDSLSPSS
jgi:hypothetical protein